MKQNAIVRIKCACTAFISQLYLLMFHKYLYNMGVTFFCKEASSELRDHVLV